MRTLPIHKRLYLSVMAITVVSQIFWPTAWWFFWPLMIWTLIFFVHSMVIRTINVDENWVDERTEQLTDNAFDLAHIEAIRERISEQTYGEAYGTKKDSSASDKE